ncbi:unnamed protein product [Lactuca virosa]|uniref:Uncharacterized protein n=1 Tax=Lactuca virosa TaxID=75947 RepID=A0AAU9N1W5_9ASTR|nr:unnamed protein product [Lactuca virosa]
MARAEMTGRSRPIENRGMTMYSFPYGAYGVAYFERGRRGQYRPAGRGCFPPRYHKDHCPATARGYLRSPTEQNGSNSRERRDKKREGSAETQVPLPELPEPEVEVEGLLSEKKRQMIRTVVALAEQGAYREDWGNEEFDDLAHRLHLSLNQLPNHLPNRIINRIHLNLINFL